MSGMLSSYAKIRKIRADRATAYAAGRAWHAACDSCRRERLSAVRCASTEGHRDASIHPRGRRATDSPAAGLPPRRDWRSALAAALPAKAQDTIKVGILHSLSGTMAISETTLKDVMLMLIDEQNKKGGVLGKKLEAVVVDPASNWPLFAEKARELITKDKVAVGVRLLDLGVAQVGAAGVQGAQLDPVLSGAVRRRGERAQRVLHRRRAQPAGDPGGRLSDARKRR